MLKSVLIFILLIIFVLRYMTVCDNNFCSEEVVSSSRDSKDVQSGERGVYADSLQPFIYKFRERSVQNIHRLLPSPHSELMLGMVLGIDNLKSVPRINDVLRRTGTIHVVVVSGFNISLIYSLIVSVIGSPYKIKNLLVATFTALIYAVICGFEPPVVRAWIMGSIVAWGRFYGRALDSLRVLVMSALFMLIFQPAYLQSLSFQLSFCATLSLMLFTSIVTPIVEKFTKSKSVLTVDLTTTLAAQVLVWPLISYNFGRVSLVSPLVNSLILWTVPLATILGGLTLFLSFVSLGLARIASLLVYVPLDIFIRVANFFGNASWIEVNFQVSLLFLIFYYGVLGICVWRRFRLST